MRSIGSKIVIICICLFISMLTTVYMLFYPRIRIKSTIINLDEEVVVTSNNMFSRLDSFLTVESDVDNTNVGKYTVKANVKYLFYNVNKTFEVTVKDNIRPEITLKGNVTPNVCPYKDYDEEGYEAIDNIDGDITDKVIITKIDNSIWYEVSDVAGNSYKIERKLNFKDEEKPTITLKSSDSLTVYVGNSYNEPGYTATDNCDGDITDKVVSTGTVDTGSMGTYTISYTVIDKSSNETTVQRTVYVREKPVPSPYSVIYLTFDDGPSERTREILDILDSEGVKATFFVCGANAYTVRAYNSGHTIALHSATHNYSYIYASSANYFADLNSISDTVYNTVGIRTNIIRFPGGSSNTISRNYNIGIMSYLTSEVVNRGYTYFDWNVDSNDAGSAVYNSNSIYYNVVNNLHYNRSNVVLMHDSGGHTATVNALRSIIQYGKDNGYSFAAITSSTYPVRHGVKN